MSILDANIFWNIANLLILMYLLHRFLYKPVVGVMEERREKIQSDLEGARREKEEAEELRKTYEEKIAGASQEARTIIEEAHRKAREKGDEIVAQAREEARKEQERTRREIKRAQAEARAQLRDEVANVSLLAAGRYLEKNLSDKEHYALMKKVIDELPEQVGDVR